MKKDYVLNLTQQFVESLIGLVLIIYLSNILSPTNYGMYAYIIAIINLMTLFSTIGINIYGSKVYLKSNRIKPFVEIFSIQVFSTITVIIIFFFFSAFLHFEFLLTIIIILNVLFISIQPLWYNIAKEKISLNNVSFIISSIIKLLLILLLVKDNNSLLVLLEILVVTNFIRFILIFLSVDEPYKISKEHLTKKNFKNYLIMFLPFLCISIYTITDKLMIAQLSTFDQVATYSIGITILRISLVLITSVIPMLIVKNVRDGDKLDTTISRTLSYTILVSIPLMFTFIILGKEVINLLLSDDYRQVEDILVYASIIIPITACSSIISSVYIAKGKNVLFFKSVLSGAIANVILNVILIPKYGAFGAIASTITAEVLILAIMLFSIRKVLNKFYLLKVISKVTIINIVIVTLISNIAIPMLLLSIVVKFLVFIIANFLLVVGLKIYK